MVTACKQVKLQGSALSAVKQKNAVRGAISILFYADEVKVTVMKQSKGALLRILGLLCNKATI